MNWAVSAFPRVDTCQNKRGIKWATTMQRRYAAGIRALSLHQKCTEIIARPYPHALLELSRLLAPLTLSYDNAFPISN